MNIWDFLQWLSVGGVTILGLFATFRNNSKSNEHKLIDQLQEELNRNSERLDSVTKRLDNLESEKSALKELNYKLQIERDNAITDKIKAELDKEKIEKELRVMGNENKELKNRIENLNHELTSSRLGVISPKG